MNDYKCLEIVNEITYSLKLLQYPEPRFFLSTLINISEKVIENTWSLMKGIFSAGKLIQNYGFFMELGVWELIINVSFYTSFLFSKFCLLLDQGWLSAICWKSDCNIMSKYGHIIQNVFRLRWIWYFGLKKYPIHDSSCFEFLLLLKLIP